MKKDYFLGLSEEGFHRVAYREWGESSPNSSVPVICVHGLTRNGSDFDSLAAFMSAQGSHLYCPDIVGRGDSDWLKNPTLYSYEQYLSDMNALIALAQAKQIDWIGTSMGGLIGMIMASLPNSPIRRLVLNDVGPQISVKGLSRLAKYAGQDPASFHSLEEAKKHYQSIYADFGPLTDSDWQHLTENSVKEVSPGQYVSKMDQNVITTPAKSKLAWKLLLSPIKALEGTFFDIDLWAFWQKVTCPVLVIHGKHSDLLLPETIEKMRQTHTNIQVYEVDNAGHAPALRERSQQEVIYRWLTATP